MKRILFAIAFSLLFAACGDSTTNEPEKTVSTGDSFEVLKTKDDGGDLQTVWVKDDSGEKTRYDVEEVLIDGSKYLLVNSDTKDTVVAEIDDEQMVVVEVREYESDFDEDEGSSGGSSGSKGSRSSSSYHYDDGDGEESKLSSSPMNIYKSGSSTTSIIGKNSDAFLNPSITYGTLVDERDGQVYKTVKIGIQNWMAQNLNFYLDTSWESIYAVGRLYRWTGAMNMPSKYLTNDACEELNSIHPQGICPDGWHVPTKEDWGKLFAYARMNGVENLGVALRAKENEAWPSKLTPATDDFGFSVAYGNYQRCDYQCRYLYNYDWNSYGDSATVFWTAECGGFFLYDDAYTVNVYADSVQIRMFSKYYAAYVRCLEDYDIDSLAQPAPVAESVYDSVKHTLTDLRNNRVYKTAQVGDQVWMAENLDYATENGYADDGVHSKCSDAFYYPWIYDPDCEKYGRFYQWNAAMDKPLFFKQTEVGKHYQGICPKGWHIPDSTEAKTLLKYARGYGSLDLILADTSWFPKAKISPLGFNVVETGVFTDCMVSESETGFWLVDNVDSIGHTLFFSGFTSELKGSIGSFFKHRYFSVRCLRDELAKPIEFEDFGTFVDSRDNQTYRTVEINGDIWMADNMNYVDESELLSTESWCYNDSAKNCEIYGRLYTWNASTLNGTEQGICPDGWHVSTNEEWIKMVEFIDDDLEVGMKLKSSNLWDGLYYPFNEYGFSALPAGFRDSTYKYFGSIATYWYLGQQANFWTSQSVSDTSAIFYRIEYDDHYVSKAAENKSVGRSVRCVKNK